MPVSTRSPPIAFSTRPRWARKRARKAANGSTANAASNERNAEAERIDREHAGALRHRLLRRRDRQDRGEDRADARRPAEREGKPHQIGAPQPDGLGDLEPLLAHQQADRGQAEEMQTHDDDGDAGEDRELARIGAQHRADRAGAGAKRHEHRGKAEHEQKRGGERLAPHRAVSASASAKRSSEVPAR